MYAALRELKVPNKVPVKPTMKRVGNRFAATMDFTKVTDDATAANRVSLLLNNIACLKDHLHVWCKKNGKPFTGDNLIDQNNDVGIIHDLWNLDKHAELLDSPVSCRRTIGSDRIRSGLTNSYGLISAKTQARLAAS